LGDGGLGKETVSSGNPVFPDSIVLLSFDILKWHIERHLLRAQGIERVA
jgi:hypothetical protein